MSYADGLLSTGERIVHREKQHWFVFVWGARFTILALIVAGLLGWFTANMAQDGTAGTARAILSWVVAILFIGGIAVLGWTILHYLNQEYVITSRRVMQVSGVLNKKSTDSSLEKINDATLTQSIFGRMFGFGDLDILTAADSGIDRFQMLRNPIDFKRAMLDAKHGYELELAGGSYVDTPPLRAETAAATTPAPAATEPPSTDPTIGAAPAEPADPGDDTVANVMGANRAQLTPDELTRTLSSLADLRDRGAISAEEYERKKADLLGRL